VLLVEDEIVTDIIIFDDIPIEECTHTEEISKDIYDHGASVQRVPMNKGGKIIMCGCRKELGKKVGALGEFQK
jgi:hypothetical protein